MKQKKKGKGAAPAPVEHNPAKKENKNAAKQGAPLQEAAQKAPEVHAEVKTPAASALPSALTPADRIWVIGFLAVVFVACAITVGKITMGVLAVVLAVTLIRFKHSLAALREHVCLPVLGLLAMILLYGLGGIYSPFNEGAIRELYRGLVSFSLAGFALLTFRKKHVPALLWGFNVICGIVSLLAVDGATLSALYTPYAALCDTMGTTMLGLNMYVDQRLATIFNNSNVGASLLALSLLIGLHHMQHEESKKRRIVAACLLGLNAMAFFMCFSRGAILSFGIALLVYLAVTRKGQRIRLFLLMFFCAAVTVVLSAVAMTQLGGASVLPLLLCFVCGPVIFLLDSLVSEKLSAVLNGRVKLLVISGAALAALLVVYVVAALNVTGPYVLDSSFVTRSVKLAPGEYTITADRDAGVNLRVETATKTDRILGTRSEVYNELTGDTTLEIGEGVTNIWVHMEGDVGAEIRSVTISDGTELKLDYKLLPATVAHRLQDNLLTSSSFLLRVQFMADALKIWSTSPIYGRGLASSEGLYTAVQPYYYESMFVHNHVLQYMADLGLLGLAAFLLFMGGALWLLIRALRRGEDPLAAMLVGCIVMMNVHGLMEISFSLRPYLIMASLLLAIMILQYGEEPLLVKNKSGVKSLGALAAVTFWILLAVFGSLLGVYRYVQKDTNEFVASNYEELMTQLGKYIKLDCFDDDYFKMVYVANGLGDGRYMANVIRYADELRDMHTYTNSSSLALNYYLPMGQYEEVFTVSLEAIAQKASDSRAWNYEIENYRDVVLPAMGAANMEEFLRGMETYRDAMVTFNQNRIGPVSLTEENEAFLNAAMQVREDGLDGETAYTILSMFLPAKEG